MSRNSSRSAALCASSLGSGGYILATSVAFHQVREETQLRVLGCPHEQGSVQERVGLFATHFGHQDARVACGKVERVHPCRIRLNAERVGGAPRRARDRLPQRLLEPLSVSQGNDPA